VAAVIGSALYAGLQVVLLGPTVSALTNAGAGTVALVGVAFLSSVIARQISAVVRQLEHARRLIDELTVHDLETGLTKWQHASQIIRSEVVRSRRHHVNLSLLFIRVANWDELVEDYGSIGAEALMAEISATIVDTLRTLVDTPTRFDSVTLGAILPETSAEDARIAAQRLIDAVARQVRVALYIGIAHFPDDAVTDEELVRAAKTALQFALTSSRSIVCYDQLHGTVEERERPTWAMEWLVQETDSGEKREALEVPRPIPKVPDSLQKAASAIRLVVRGFRGISTLSRFEEAIRQLPGVVRVEPCRYAAGTLELLVEFPVGAPALKADSVAGFDIQPVHTGNDYIEWELRDLA